MDTMRYRATVMMSLKSHCVMCTCILFMANNDDDDDKDDFSDINFIN